MILPLNPNYKVLFVLIVCLSAPLLAYQQTNTGKETLLKDFKNHIEEVYKYDDLLVNGHLYRQPLNSKIKGSPYYIKNRLWKKSTLYIKGREFSNQDVLYNIETDEFVAQIVFPGGTSRNIVLDTRYIDSLFIGTHFFINVFPYTEEHKSELYEQVYGGDFKALLKHKCTHIPEVTNSTPHGYFTQTATSLFILDKGKFIKISKRKTLLKHFVSHKKEIARYMRTNRIRLKSAEIHELFNLFKYCDDISN